ncbi:hypothetical protein DAI22_12g083500 [Oryza sativa Japonica Group]|nr:hypothetical protein DAI22_12g083500 [Oryza sativa Japonica Group]
MKELATASVIATSSLRFSCINEHLLTADSTVVRSLATSACLPSSASACHESNSQPVCPQQPARHPWLELDIICFLL